MKLLLLTGMLAAFAVPVDQGGNEKEKKTEMEDMQCIEGGTFEMGDLFGEKVQAATPVHEVTLSSFHLNKYEVTVEEFKAFVEDSGYVTSAEKPEKPAATGENAKQSGGAEAYLRQLASPGAWLLHPVKKVSWGEKAGWRTPQFEQSAKDPVTCVSWMDAIRYCNWLSRKEGLPVAYDVKSGDLLDGQGNPTSDVAKVKGYRLPTEAEWEFAARERGKKVRFGNGSNTARSSEMNFNAAGRQFPFSEKGETSKGTVPVGSFKANSLGLYDMSGNVWEWCSDFLCAYPAGPQTDPYQIKGLVAGPRRAARGGPWVGSAGDARAAARFGWPAEDRCNNIGFRLARSK